MQKQVAPQTSTEPATALGGLKVVDFSRFMPGGYISWMLADMGAEVVRIEHPREIAKQTFVAGAQGESEAEFHRRRAMQTHARNKRSLMMNPGHPQAREVILELVKAADVFIEDYRPGVVAKMGYSYQELAQLNPRLIYVSVSFAGQTGPYRGRAGHDPLALALAGALSRLNGIPTPTLPGLQVADVLSGAHGTIAALMALQARHVTGKGQYVDVAMSDACAPLMIVTMSRNPDPSKVGRPDGAWHPKGGVWECADGEYICTTDMETAYWRRFCSVIGRPEYADLQHDTARHPEMRADLETIFRTRPRDEWAEIFAEADTQSMPVLSLAEAISDPHNQARGMFPAVPHGDGHVWHVATPFHLSDTPGRIRFPATLPGAHTEEILGELGYDETRLAELRTAGVFNG